MAAKPDRTRDPDASGDILRRLHARFETERGWRGRLRSLPTAVRRLACLLVLLLTALAVGLFVRRSDFAVYPALSMGAGLLLFAALALVSVRLFLWPVHERSPGRARTAVWALLGLGVPLAFALLPEAHGLIHEHPESFEGRGADFWPRAAGCLLFGLVTSLPPLGLLLAFDRRERPTTVRLAFAAAAGGLAGNLVLLVHCPIVTRGHLLAGHASVGLVVLLLLGLAARAGARREDGAPPAGGM